MRGDDTVAVAIRFAITNSQICFLLGKSLATSSAISKKNANAVPIAVGLLTRQKLHRRFPPESCTTCKGQGLVDGGFKLRKGKGT